MGFAGMLGAFAALIAPSIAEDTPKPLVIPASQYLPRDSEGNDGPWSTFDLRLGTPEQFIRVLVSTASPHALVPLADVACSASVFTTVPRDCAVSRGNLFNPNESSSWHDVGLYGINQNGVGLEANLGYEQRAQFGLEKLGIGLNGPSLDNQTVGGIATPAPFYLGVVGLNNQPLNFSSLGNHPSPSILTTLKEQKKIPSLSWSYTAGAKYRLKQVYGQLVFSGYDASRFMENTVSFSMADDVTRDLVVALQSISYSGSSSATLLSNPIDIFIDSTDRNIWLPEDACDAFEKAFGLTLDTKSGLYLINNTHRNTLLDTNAQVSFRLSDVKSGGDTVTIVLPFAAFDLTAGPPLVENTSHYFPLKRANSSTQYTLGRVFLQEAYLSADYERKTFNLSSCVWNQGAQENIVPITSTSDTSSSNPSSGSSGSHLPGGAIAGIVIGCLLAGLLIAAAIALVILRRRRRRLSTTFAASAKPPQPHDSVLKGPVFNSLSDRHGSSPGDDSMPFSADDVSGNRSRQTTAEHSVVALGSGTGGSTVELDGRDTAVRPDTELDGHEVRGPLPAVAESPGGVFELPGSKVPEYMQGIGGDRDGVRVLSAVNSSPSNDGDGSPPSPLTSTWGPGRESLLVDGGRVSTDTPVRRKGDGLF